jgi:hypothetical protein
MSKLTAVALCTLLLLPLSAPATAATPFDQGRIQLGLGVGSAGSFDTRYVVAGARFGVFVLDGLQLGIDADFWLGGSPFVATVSPDVRYVLYFLDPLNPYLGVFYRHWFVGEEIEDIDNLGARVGFIWVLGEHVYLGIGAAYERTVSQCSGTCGVYYPELALSIAL